MVSDRVTYWLAGLVAVCCAGGTVFAAFVIVDPSDDGPRDTPVGASANGPSDGPGWTVVVPDASAGFVRLDLAFATAGDETRRTSLSALGLANPASGQYHEEGTAPEPWLTFLGGDLVPTLDEAGVAAATEPRLAAVFGVLGMTFDGTMRPFDAGPMGGELRCTTLTAPSRQPVACGWVDRWTVGAIVDLRSGQSEDRVADLLVSMRPDYEVARL